MFHTWTPFGDGVWTVEREGHPHVAETKRTYLDGFAYWTLALYDRKMGANPNKN